MYNTDLLLKEPVLTHSHVQLSFSLLVQFQPHPHTLQLMLQPLGYLFFLEPICPVSKACISSS